VDIKRASNNSANRSLHSLLLSPKNYDIEIMTNPTIREPILSVSDQNKKNNTEQQEQQRQQEDDDDSNSCDSDSSDGDYPSWVRSIRSKTGLETGVEIEFPGCTAPSILKLTTCMQEADISPMFSGTQWAGTRVWRSSIVAIQYILQEFGTTFVDNQRKTAVTKTKSSTTTSLVELGCGLGVPGMIVHAMLGWNVVLTDKDPLPKQLEVNCKSNFPVDYGQSILAHELDWSREGVQELVNRNYFSNSNTTTATATAKKGFDVCINCDCVYEPLYGLSWKLLVETMDELLRINPKTVVMTCLERRKSDGVDNFLEALRESQHISSVERIVFDKNNFPEVHLYRIYGVI